MNNNIRVARQLIKIAKEIISDQRMAYPTDTYDGFSQYSKDCQEKYNEQPDAKLWDLFETQEEVDAFLQNKAKDFPHLKQIISEESIKKLLDEQWFVIVSAGRNNEEIKEHSITDQEIKERYNKLRQFLQILNLPYYQVIGQYGHSSELSYIVDLSNNGTNDETTIKSNLRKIRTFCGNELKQDAIIEGLGKQRVYMYTQNGDFSYSQKTRQLNPVNDIGRSQVFTDKGDRRKNVTWADDFDFETKNQGDWIK